MHQRSHKDEEPEVIDLKFGVDHALSQLMRSLGMVVDLELIDGTAACGVLGAATSDVLILEHWTDSEPNGDPFTVSIDRVRRIVIP